MCNALSLLYHRLCYALDRTLLCLRNSKNSRIPKIPGYPGYRVGDGCQTAQIKVQSSKLKVKQLKSQSSRFKVQNHLNTVRSISAFLAFHFGVRYSVFLVRYSHSAQRRSTNYCLHGESSCTPSTASRVWACPICPRPTQWNSSSCKTFRLREGCIACW